ncbi:hypothetical protein GMDG_04420 [Pseudogymnoascus destructans 20631-21]|uniref:Uncharacterized protein n=1 Tax=Pseudogymnoascus destructans (strain ATCC MYA-4855 / 20631-21) TaxID=658429 RepID=L8GAL8_PSED2|nr:hypothetical protein GMDG_04420 [Pseudogymnoascus destructans 20631-21]
MQLLRAASRPEPYNYRPYNLTTTTTSRPSTSYSLQGDPIAIGLEHLISVVKRAASQIGSALKEEEREEKDAVIKKRLEDLESKVSTVNDNVAQMLAMMQQREN